MQIFAALLVLRPDATILYLHLKSRGTNFFLLIFIKGLLDLGFAVVLVFFPPLVFVKS